MNQMMPQQDAPAQMPPQAPPYQSEPDEVANGHRALDAVINGLIKLVSIPKGDLTKKDVFDETSTMIANGAFPTPEAKQQLIGELATLPNDESGIREILGKHLLTVADFRDHYHNAFGPPQDANQMPSGEQT